MPAAHSPLFAASSVDYVAQVLGLSGTWPHKDQHVNFPEPVVPDQLRLEHLQRPLQELKEADEYANETWTWHFSALYFGKLADHFRRMAPHETSCIEVLDMTMYTPYSIRILRQKHNSDFLEVVATKLINIHIPLPNINDKAVAMNLRHLDRLANTLRWVWTISGPEAAFQSRLVVGAKLAQVLKDHQKLGPAATALMTLLGPHEAKRKVRERHQLLMTAVDHVCWRAECRNQCPAMQAGTVRCTRCRVARYCSEGHRAADWEDNHWRICLKPTGF